MAHNSTKPFAFLFRVFDYDAAYETSTSCSQGKDLGSLEGSFCQSCCDWCERNAITAKFGNADLQISC